MCYKIMTTFKIETFPHIAAHFKWAYCSCPTFFNWSSTKKKSKLYNFKTRPFLILSYNNWFSRPLKYRKTKTMRYPWAEWVKGESESEVFFLGNMSAGWGWGQRYPTQFCFCVAQHVGQKPGSWPVCEANSSSLTLAILQSSKKLQELSLSVACRICDELSCNGQCWKIPNACAIIAEQKHWQKVPQQQWKKKHLRFLVISYEFHTK